MVRAALLGGAFMVAAACTTTSPDTQTAMVAPEAAAAPEPASAPAPGAPGSAENPIDLSSNSTVPTGSEEQRTYQTTDGEKIICKYSKATGTRTKRVKTCMTREEWARKQSNATRSMDRFKEDNANTKVYQ